MNTVRPQVSPSSPPGGPAVNPSVRSIDASHEDVIENWRRDVARYVAYRQRRFRGALRRALIDRRGRGRSS